MKWWAHYASKLRDLHLQALRFRGPWQEVRTVRNVDPVLWNSRGRKIFRLRLSYRT